MWATRVWAPTIGHLCLFLEGGPPETWHRLVIGWIVTARSLLWRVLHSFLFFFLLSFQLNVECSTLKGHSECVKICVCVFVCFHRMLLFFPSLLYQFYTEIFKWKPGYQLGWNPRPTFILSLTTVMTFQNKRRLQKNYYHSVSKIPCVKSPTRVFSFPSPGLCGRKNTEC